MKPTHWMPAATAVLLLATLARMLWLADVPPGLAQDEVLNADIVTFIRQGQHALFFREGYGHEPLYHYWSVPFQVLLGDNLLSMRLPAVVLGLLLVAATLRWVRRDFQPNTALLTGLFLALSWWPIIFSRIGLRPIMEPLFLVAMAYFWRTRPWVAALCLGLCTYTYTGARVMLLLPLLLAGWARWHGRDWRTPLQIFTLALLIYAPLQLTLWADPTLQQRVDQLAEPLEALRHGNFQPLWENTRNTLGVFSFTGDPRWNYTIPDRPFFDPVTSLLFYAGLLLLIFRPRFAASPNQTIPLVAIWFALALLPSAITPQSPSTIRLIGLLPLVYLLPSLTLTSLKSRLQLSRPFWLALLFLVFVLNASRTWQDGFVTWPQQLETRTKYQTIWQSIARHWQHSPQPALVVADSWAEPIDFDSLRRNVGRPVPARWVQAAANQTAGALVYPSAPAQLYVPEFAPIPPDLLAVGGFGDPISRTTAVPSFAIYPVPPAPPLAPLPNPVAFKDVNGRVALTLIAHHTPPHQPNQPLILYTYWRVDALLPPDLALFIHLTDRDPSHIIAQHDGLDAAPRTLQIGDHFLQRHLLWLPNGQLTSEYQLWLGIYQRYSNSRWQQPHPPFDRWLFASGR